ncbi:RagB/SusD family nutrient uptake outer membrane protein [Ekhidna sp.]
MKKIALVIMIFTASSCGDDFLDVGLVGSLNETFFLETEEDAILATNSIYNNLRDWRYHEGFPILDIMSDEARKGSNPADATQILVFDNFTYGPGEPSILGWYTTLYQTIRRANLVIEKIGDIEIEKEFKERLEGEARFLRAYTYFQLVRGYGNVPLVTTTSPPEKIERTDKDIIYDDLIIPDLLYAIEELPEKGEYASEDLGRASRGAAKGILAKVYLTRGDFPNAEIYALEVIMSGQYMLDPVYSNVFSVDGEHGSGSIFEVGALPENFQEGGHQYANTQGSKGVPNRGWGFNRPSIDLINSYEVGDPRMDASIIFLGETLDGITIEGHGGTLDTTYTDETETEILEIECYNQKTYASGTTAIESWQYNVRILRYADVLLMVAEALNENDKPDQALIYLNSVRERAREGNNAVLPDVTTTDKIELRDAILNERKVELALEKHRFFDLVRTGRAAEVLGPLGFTADKNEVFPIPQSERDLSNGLLTQNDGYN